MSEASVKGDLFPPLEEVKEREGERSPALAQSGCIITTSEKVKGDISSHPGETTPLNSTLSPEKEKTRDLSYTEEVKSPEMLQGDRFQAIEAQLQAITEECKTLRKQLLFDIGSPTNPTTLKSDKLTPELIAIGSTLHMWDYGILNNNIDSDRWAYPFGYHTEIGHSFLTSASIMIDRVQQLPQQNNSNGSRFPVNILFPSPHSREVGVHSLKQYCEAKNIKNLPLHYSLTQTPILQHQIKGLSLILKELKKERVIKWYSLNNFMAVNTNAEKIAPIFSYQTQFMDIPSKFSDCPSNEYFFNGNIIPISDKKFTSDEFQLLKVIVRTSLECNQDPNPMYDIYNLPEDCSSLDFTKPRNKGNRPFQHRRKYSATAKPVSPVKQSTPTTFRSMRNKTNETYSVPPPSKPTLADYIHHSISLDLDQNDSTPNTPNLSIPPPTSSENSGNTSPDITETVQDEIEIHEKTYTNLN